VQSDDLHIGLVSWFLSILSLRGRLNLGNNFLSHIYLNLFRPMGLPRANSNHQDV
jgi:hypothetical protein